MSDPSNPLDDFVDAVGMKDMVSAGNLFTQLMQDKVSTALDQEKIAVAGQVFNDDTPDEEQLELDLEDDADDDLLQDETGDEEVVTDEPATEEE